MSKIERITRPIKERGKKRLLLLWIVAKKYVSIFLSIMKSNILYNWWQSIYILLSLGRSRVLMVTKCSYMIETFYEAPHWGFITGILHKHNVKTKVNQLSKIKITQSQCHLDVWIKDKKWITLKQKSDFKWILHLISFMIFMEKTKFTYSYS